MRILSRFDGRCGLCRAPHEAGDWVHLDRPRDEPGFGALCSECAPLIGAARAAKPPNDPENEHWSERE